jgi:basic membrane protein A and related proteins
MKKGLSILVILSILLTLFVIGAVEASDKVRVALIIPSTIDDMAWSQTMYEGLIAMQKEMGEENFELEVSERMYNAVDAGSAIRQYASEGYDIVVAHGAQYQSVLSEIAPDFPNTSFAYGTGFKTTEDNIFAYDPQAQEGAYLLGMLAGMITKTNVIGIVGPVESGDAIKYNNGFRKGAMAANPDVEVRIAYTGSFGDLVAAGEIANTHMDAGADILSGSSQQSVGAVRAIADRENHYWLSTDMDQTSIAPNAVLAAQEYNFKEVVNLMIENRKNGINGGKHIVLSFANGTLELKFNKNSIDIIPQDVLDKINEVKEKIANGELVIDAQ